MKQLLCIVTVMAMVLCSAASPAQSSTDIQWDQVPAKTRMALYKAQQEMNENRIEKAISMLLAFQKKRPDDNHFLIEFNIGTAYGLLNNYTQAIVHLEKTVALAETYAPAWVNLGKLYYQTKDFSRAGAALEKGFRSDVQKDPEILFIAMAACYQGNDLAKTVALGEELLFTFKWEKNDIVSLLASTYIGLGNFAGAVDMLKRLTASDPSKAEVWKLLAQAHFKNQQFKEAAIAYEIYGFLHNPSREELVVMGDLFNMVGVPQQASHYYEQALQGGGTADEYEKMSVAYYTAYEFDKAIAAVDKAIAAEANAERLLLKAQLYYLRDDFGEAQSYYVKAAEVLSKDGHEWLMAGYCAMRAGNIDLARQLLHRASEFPAQRTEALAMLRTMSPADEIKRAMQEFKEANRSTGT